MQTLLNIILLITGLLAVWQVKLNLSLTESHIIIKSLMNSKDMYETRKSLKYTVIVALLAGINIGALIMLTLYIIIK